MWPAWRTQRCPRWRSLRSTRLLQRPRAREECMWPAHTSQRPEPAEEREDDCRDNRHETSDQLTNAFTMHFTPRVKKRNFGLQWFDVELKPRAPVYRQIVLSARLKFACQFAKQIKMHKLMRNACTKKIIITPTKSFRKKLLREREAWGKECTGSVWACNSPVNLIFIPL